MSYKLRDIYSIDRRYCNAATYKWKVLNEKIEIIYFIVRFRSYAAFAVNFEMYISRHEKPSCISGILDFKLNGTDAINKVIKRRIT